MSKTIKICIRFLIIIFFASGYLLSCKEDGNWTKLLDKDLSNWDNYLSYRHQNGYKGQEPLDLDGNIILPIGLNKTGYNVFTVTEENNVSVLKISGEIYGALISKEEYSDYHLRLKVKWGDKKWVPREKLLKDSGILYHSIGEPGAEYWRTWMLSQEFQIMEGHIGDYWSQVTSAIDIKAYMPESKMNAVADESQSFLPMGKGEEISGFCLRSANYENEPGEWNTVELICFGDKSLHIVNGHVVMILRNSRYTGEGKVIPLTRGKIQIQSEAAEVYYKDIEIKNLKVLPEVYAQYFVNNQALVEQL